MLTNVIEINQEILAYLDIPNIINLLNTDENTRNIVIKNFPIDKLFKDRDRYEDDVKLIAQLLQFGAIELVIEIINIMYKLNGVPPLSKIFLSNSIPLIELSLSLIPQDFSLDNFYYAFTFYRYNICQKNIDEIVEHIKNVSFSLIKSKNIVIIDHWITMICRLTYGKDELKLRTNFYLEMCKLSISLLKLNSFCDKEELFRLMNEII